MSGVSDAPGEGAEVPLLLVTSPADRKTLAPSGSSSSSKYVKFNVGGFLHYTTVQTLSKQETALKAMSDGNTEVLRDQEGWILVDRSGQHFGTLLNYLRDGSIPLPEAVREIKELLLEAKYYLIEGLVEDCQQALKRRIESCEAECRIPMITSAKEEQKIISASAKPVVKLVHNRSNNKYSYTSNSDDNLLKNIELFDKLALRFNGRILFAKDVLGDEICCWSFYGQGRKIAEICCTSIVYATEKKQTKVEFPEARIFEETLNTLMYESPRPPERALLEVTGSGGQQHSDDEDRRVRRERVRRIHVRRHITHDEGPHGQPAIFKD
ncbi:BTB/POZ domain-containing adapter for CUL3-mediated RhoA degradation protein 1-like [Carcharodon carcharias]|uniref:BTB/POZ domain-containing adapter for CUL3-mediated RhoA degradation protein 1-like n=1 Tax=Carcharodon carcharias TaxID=13397 RepID=UPI001B7E5EE9|nr:BTB/POZ domain-containing adapter for CUL3-mediated RhoA degradation protein 1-like [Carcharodon carcharias]